MICCALARNTGNCSSSRAEPTCSNFLAPRFSEKTTCTAVAGEAVLTVRTYGLTTDKSTGHPHATRLVRKYRHCAHHLRWQQRQYELDHSRLSQVGRNCPRLPKPQALHLAITHPVRTAPESDQGTLRPEGPRKALHDQGGKESLLDLGAGRREVATTRFSNAGP